MRKVTGVNSLAEVVEKIKKQKENKKQLVLEKRDADSRLAGAKQMREKLEKRFSELRASGIGTTEMNRDVADDLEKDIDIARAELKTTTQDCERLEGTLIGLRTGAVGLYERLIPYFNLLEDQPDLVKKGAPDPKTIETAEALVLSEAMLVKMIELLGGGDNKDEGALVLEDPSVDEMNVSLAPGNNLRIKSEEQKENEKSVKESVFLTAVDEDEADDGLAPGDPSELVPARSFIKKSAARQYESAIRAEAEKKRASKLEELSEGPGAAKGSKAARKKAQDEWLKEAGKPINNLHPLTHVEGEGLCARPSGAAHPGLPQVRLSKGWVLVASPARRALGVSLRPGSAGPRHKVSATWYASRLPTPNVKEPARARGTTTQTHENPRVPEARPDRPRRPETAPKPAAGGM